MKKVMLVFGMLMSVLSSSICVGEEKQTERPKAIYAEPCENLWCLVLEPVRAEGQRDFVLVQQQGSGQLIARRPLTDYPVQKVKVMVEGDISERGMTVQEIVLQTWNGEFRDHSQVLSVKSYGFLKDRKTIDIFCSSVIVKKSVSEITIKSIQKVQTERSHFLLVFLFSLFFLILTNFRHPLNKQSFSVSRVITLIAFLSSIMIIFLLPFKEFSTHFEVFSVIIIALAIAAILLEAVASRLPIAVLSSLAVGSVFVSSGWINGLLCVVVAALAVFVVIFLRRIRTRKEWDKTGLRLVDSSSMPLGL